MRPTLCPWLLTRGVSQRVDRQFGQRPATGSTQRRRKARGRTPWFGWPLRRSGTAVRFRQQGQVSGHPCTQGPLPDSGQRRQESPNLMPWYCMHSEGGNTQDQSNKWRPKAATKEQQYQRQQDQHQATPHRCTNNTDQTDNAKPTITVRMPLSKKVGSTVKAGSPARTVKAAVSGHD